MDRKYELIESDIRDLHRIKALRDFGDVKKGDVGGYVENEYNLSHDGECWIYYDAAVYENATVWNDVKIRDEARIYGNAMINDNVVVCNNAIICDEAKVRANTRVCGDSVICGNARIGGNAKIKKGMHIGKINEKFKDILYIQCENRLITVYKDINNIIKCNIGCQKRMTLEDLLKRIEEDGGMTKDREEYIGIMENAHLLLGWEKRGVKRWKVFDELAMHNKMNENVDNTGVRCFGILENIIKNKFDIETIVKDLNGSITKNHYNLDEAVITKSSDDNFEISLSDVSNYQRIRFSIAHELGHLFLHMHYLNEEKWSNIEIGTSHTRNTNIPYTEYESEASEFAGAFLMPKLEFIKVANENIEDNYYNLKNISDEFDVSIEVVNARGKTLKLWDLTKH